MKKTKHTPGPWTYADGVLKSDNESLAILVIPKNVVSNEPERIANARLIAAAPELLEALEHLSREICAGEYVKHSPDALRKLNAAIVKARGES